MIESQPQPGETISHYRTGETISHYRTGETISHYRILEKLVGEEWEWFTRPKTLA